MSVHEQKDLFPWILGGFLIAAAIPAVLALNGSPRRSAPVENAAFNPVPVAIAAPILQPVYRPETLASVEPPVPPPTRQVWQCDVDGQKVYSDKRCGADASVRQLSEVNRMQATPVSRAPAYSGYPVYPSSGYSADYPDPDSANVDGSASSPFIVINERGRREDGRRSHRPEHHLGSTHGGLSAR